MTVARRLVLIAGMLVAACLEGERLRGNVPLADAPAPVVVSPETFLRRAFADLHGIVPGPDDARWRSALGLLAAGVTPAARAAVVDALVADRAYADAFFDEHATPLFSALGGIEGAYRFLLYYIDELVGMTADPAERQFLSAYRETLAAERGELLALPERLHAQAIDEADLVTRLARSAAAFVLSGPDAYARVLYRDLVGREPGAHELKNAVAMARLAAFVPPDAPVAGVVLRREGRTLDDLARILVGSDAFLEARIRALFGRLLGLDPEPALVWPLFAALRDARRRGDYSGGYRDLLRTIVASDAYVRR